MMVKLAQVKKIVFGIIRVIWFQHSVVSVQLQRSI